MAVAIKKRTKINTLAVPGVNMSVKIREQRGKLYLDIYQNGERKWESLHITLSDDKKQNKELYRLAEVCRSKREAQLLAGEWGIRTDAEKSISLVSYLKKHASRQVNPRPMIALIKHVESFPGGESVLIGQVTPKWIEDFQANLLTAKMRNGKQISQTSVGSYMKLVKTVFKKALSDGIISKDPVAGVSLVKVVDPEMVFLNADEVRQFAGVVPESDFEKEIRRTFLFGCFTGLRVSDLESLTWGMIERNPPQIIKRQEKTHNPVYVPLNKSACALIFDGKEHLPDELVFSLATDKTKTYRILKNIAAKAGITKKIGWHTARRTFATLTLGYGADAVTVARLLGHSGLSQVMKYAKATDEMKRRAVEALPDLL